MFSVANNTGRATLFDHRDLRPGCKTNDRRFRFQRSALQEEIGAFRCQPLSRRGRTHCHRARWRCLDGLRAKCRRLDWLLDGRIDAPSEYRNREHGNDGNCQSSVHWGAVFIRPKNEPESKTKTVQVRPAHAWKLLLCTTNSRTTPKLGNQLMAHTPHVLSLSEVGEASAELVSDDYPVFHWQHELIATARRLAGNKSLWDSTRSLRQAQISRGGNNESRLVEPNNPQRRSRLFIVCNSCRTFTMWARGTTPRTFAPG